MSTLGSMWRPLRSSWHDVAGAVARGARLFESHLGPLSAAALVVATFALAVLALIVVGSGSGRNLRAALRPYQVGRHAAPGADDEVNGARRAVRRLPVALGGLAERRGLREAITVSLRRAGLTIETGEFLTLCLVGSVVLLAIGAFLGGFLGLVGALCAAAGLPAVILRRLADRRRKLFATQVPDVLRLLAASLRAGFSLLQSLDAMTDQVAEPMASELRRAFAATRLGASVEEALDGVSERIASRDFAWTVTAIRIQRSVGGNLAEILDTVAATMTERYRLRNEVKALTAEGRISAIIVGALPLCLGAFIFMMNRPYLMTLFQSLGGELALAGGVLLELVGAWWLYRIVQIEA